MSSEFHNYCVKLMVAVAPEKRGALEKLVAETGVVFVPDSTSDDISFGVTPGNTPTINVGLKCIGRLWAHAFAYFCVHTEVAAAIAADPNRRDLNLRDTPRMRTAGDILQWAVNAEIDVLFTTAGFAPNSAVRDLPAGCPVPFAPSAFASDAHVADELTLMAIGWILIHEMGHVALNHSVATGVTSYEQEKDADRFATDWLLDDDDVQPDARIKRMLGVATALGWLATFEIYVPTVKSDSHPPGYDRLYQSLDQYVSDSPPYNVIWAFVISALGLHIQNQGLPIDLTTQFSSFKAAANHYVDAISKHYAAE